MVVGSSPWRGRSVGATLGRRPPLVNSSDLVLGRAECAAPIQSVDPHNPHDPDEGDGPDDPLGWLGARHA